jgi:pSer/pThr/pTyr-binding forkhead associated (FHA) protein
MELYLKRSDKKENEAVPLPRGAVSIGRNPKNTIVLAAEEKYVSGYHALIYADPNRLLLQDLQSTNGTFVNGRQVHECALSDGDEIALGKNGPKFIVINKENTDKAERGAWNLGLNPADGVNLCPDDDIPPAAAHKRTQRVSIEKQSESKSAIGKIIIPTVSAAVALVALVWLVTFMFGGNTGTTPPSSGKTKPNAPQKNFFSISDDMSFAVTDEDRRLSPIEEKIDAILLRFGETNYHAPAEMVERVEYYLAQYSGSRKRTIALYMERRKKYFPMIRRVFAEKNVPHELAYVSMLESGLDPQAVSPSGAKGLWQFMPQTARNYGLEVTSGRDERADPEKATYAAAAYFKDLIAIFGSRSSVMLCMAAYNAGEQRVIKALKRIDDPVKDRDFWYLYKMKWLAEETNEYIPQVIALIIISENPAEYGFEE